MFLYGGSSLVPLRYARLAQLYAQRKPSRRSLDLSSRSDRRFERLSRTELVLHRLLEVLY